MIPKDTKLRKGILLALLFGLLCVAACSEKTTAPNLPREEAYKNGFIFRKSADNTFEVVRGPNDSLVVIPEEYLGTPITSIANGAFYYNHNMTSVSIPSSVTSIGWHAFADCSSLEKIIIPRNVTYVGTSAFFKCYSLTIYAQAESQPGSWDSAWNLLDNEHEPVTYVLVEWSYQPPTP